MTTNLPDHVRRNQAVWAEWAPGYAEWAPRAWASEEITWGNFSVPERDLQALPRALDGLDVVELGCGTAYFSSWLDRRGARPVGLDASPAQLATAQRMQRQFGRSFPLVLGTAEATPFPDARFDLVISEYGASIWCDPHRWIPEAARILRPGGSLVFLVNSTLLILCTPIDAESDTPATTRLERPFFGLHRVEWQDGSVNFYLPPGEWFRLLRDAGFEVEDLIDIQAPEGATALVPIVTPEWARNWPSEEIWKARRR